MSVIAKAQDHLLGPQYQMVISIFTSVRANYCKTRNVDGTEESASTFQYDCGDEGTMVNKPQAIQLHPRKLSQTLVIISGVWTTSIILLIFLQFLGVLPAARTGGLGPPVTIQSLFSNLFAQIRAGGPY